MNYIQFPSFLKYLLIISLFCLPLTWGNTTTHPYPGNPSKDKLSPALKQSSLMQQAPKVHVKRLTLTSHDSQGHYYSTYVIQPQKQWPPISHYKTRETIKPGGRFPGVKQSQQAVVYGQGVSFGGIFWPLEKMALTNSKGQQVYYNKIDIYSVSHISGQLFPLKVDNTLRFHFQRIHVRCFKKQCQRSHDQGIIVYKVVKKRPHYAYSSVKIPGAIYRIEVWESTQQHPQWYLTDIYDYAPQLGWYVSDRYFNKANKNLAHYFLQKYCGK
jgi:hypothetical protein